MDLLLIILIYFVAQIMPDFALGSLPQFGSRMLLKGYVLRAWFLACGTTGRWGLVEGRGDTPFEEYRDPESFLSPLPSCHEVSSSVLPWASHHVTLPHHRPQSKVTDQPWTQISETEAATPA